MHEERGIRRWAIGVLMAVIAVAVGVAAYNMGLSHGMAEAAAAAGGTAPPYPYYYHRPWGFGFPILFPFLFFAFWFLAARLFFWRGPWGRRGWYGPYGEPDAFDAWHRRAHERMSGSSTPPAGDAHDPGRR